ncbi:hypothetical protein TNIN_282801 [Trichonephila inaurata madagascariensis]|uniref:Uncharacterized protein n=1 Tax=Trichonephila inaurata madagascariensis TaxID=2747483 RepID=A0A8X6Y9J6_9ARAC|nr:hypothetical protein TNIN_282801 [Trichonephila inaurata madagascariensis]
MLRKSFRQDIKEKVPTITKTFNDCFQFLEGSFVGQPFYAKYQVEFSLHLLMEIRYTIVEEERVKNTTHQFTHTNNSIPIHTDEDQSLYYSIVWKWLHVE